MTLVLTVCILCCRKLTMEAVVSILRVGQSSACGKHVLRSGGACLAADCIGGSSNCSSLHKWPESVVMSQFGDVAHGHKQCSVGDLSTAYCSSLYCDVQGKSGMGMYSQFEKERDQGNFDLLPELHSVLSGMKVCSPDHSMQPAVSPILSVSDPARLLPTLLCWLAYICQVISNVAV